MEQKSEPKEIFMVGWLTPEQWDTISSIPWPPDLKLVVDQFVYNGTGNNRGISAEKITMLTGMSPELCAREMDQFFISAHSKQAKSKSTGSKKSAGPRLAFRQANNIGPYIFGLIGQPEGSTKDPR